MIVTQLAIGFAAIIGAMVLLWILSLLLKDSSIVDIFWGLGFVLQGWVYFFITPDGVPARKWLVVALVTAWGLRLAGYLLWRNWGREDFRYQQWREEHGERWWWWSLIQVFLLQGVLNWVVALPLLAGQTASTPLGLGWIEWVGIAIWGIGMVFETVGDIQLAMFKAKPENKGKVLNTGLWRYTRHPNYFGNFMIWWGIFVVALAAGGWWSIIGPVVMTVLLMRVSGASLLERSLKQTKPEYAEYIRTTSEFFPWPPKK